MQNLIAVLLFAFAAALLAISLLTVGTLIWGENNESPDLVDIAFAAAALILALALAERGRSILRKR